MGGGCLLFLDLIEVTLNEMGYELVDFKKLTHGLLRIYIDYSFEQQTYNKIITIKDCEKVTYQLLRVFLVEKVDYSRLEVSSPGLDRPLKKMRDYIRFVNKEAIVKLKMQSPDVVNYKLFRGVLRPPKDENLKLEFKETDGSSAILNFTLADVYKACLVPKVNFRSRKA